MNLFTLYSRLPVFLQSALENLQGYIIQKRRFNGNFERELARFENHNPTEVDKVQLKSFIHHAIKSPFWRERFERYGVDVDSPNLLGEIKKLPVLTKDEVRANTDLIKLDVSGDKVIQIGTSGTSGSSVHFSLPVWMESEQSAVCWRYRKWHGIRRDFWLAWFGGRTIVAVEHQKPPLWRVNYPVRQIRF